MPIQLDDVDILPEVAGMRSALVVPCNMCPAVSLALTSGRPFLQLFRHLLSCAPFARYIRDLQVRLGEEGLDAEVFRSDLPHHFFVCMWTAGRRRKLQKHAKNHDVAIVLGCESATQTVRDAVGETDCKVVQGMEAVGFLNARPRFHLPGNVSFEEGRTIPLPRRAEGEDA